LEPVNCEPEKGTAWRWLSVEEARELSFIPGNEEWFAAVPPPATDGKPQVADQTPPEVFTDNTTRTAFGLPQITGETSPAPEPIFCFTCDKRCEDVNGFSSCCHTSLQVEVIAAPPDPTLRAGSKVKRSTYRGVCVHVNKWRAQFMLRGKMRYLGTYPVPETAAQVYDNAVYYLNAEKFWPRPVRLNFPERYSDASTRPAPFHLVKSLLLTLRLAGPAPERKVRGKDKATRSTIRNPFA
jgi:hypothetical protein